MSCEGETGAYNERRVIRFRMRTFDQSRLQIGRPNDLALALHGLPALAAGDDGLDGVIDAAGGGDGIREVICGGDVYVLSEVVAMVGSHVGRVADVRDGGGGGGGAGTGSGRAGERGKD